MQIDERSGRERSPTGIPGTAASTGRPTPVQVRRRRLLALVGVLAVLGCGAAWIVSAVTGGHGPAAPVGPACHATVGGSTFDLERDQARNATVIAAVSRKLGFADHAVTVALAAALQESQLHNLNYGDRDSLGLFQQRPSQGWGSPAQILDPAHATAAFYAGLAKISAWEALPVTVAAQRVQRSAAPDAYARWEPEARVLAQVLTGEAPAGFACAGQDGVPASAGAVTRAMASDLGPVALDAVQPAATGWTVVSWLLARADDLHLATVTYAGHSWSVTTGRWSSTPSSDGHIRLG